MKVLLISCCLITLTIATISLANADIRAPKPSTEKQGKIVLRTGLEIVPDAKISEARLQITESELQYLCTALGGTDNNRPLAAAITQNSKRIIVAGVLLFLSISFAGVWWARASRRGTGVHRVQKFIMVGLILVATIGVAAIITRGNIGPPGYYRWRNLPKSLSQGKAMVGELDIEIVPDDSSRKVRLLIPLRKDVSSGEE